MEQLDFALAEGEMLTCVQRGPYLVEDGGARLAVLISRLRHEELRVRPAGSSSGACCSTGAPGSGKTLSAMYIASLMEGRRRLASFPRTQRQRPTKAVPTRP